MTEWTPTAEMATRRKRELNQWKTVLCANEGMNLISDKQTD